jgi:LPXTG-site transpeptidase (sortase) family protein
LLLFYFTQVANNKTTFQGSTFQSQIVSKVSLGLPVRLIIPAINVNTKIQYVGVTPKGEMEIPSNATDVGWFKLGPRPGERGSAVIAGHLDGENGKTGVFINLYKLKKGNKLYIKDAKGKTISFVVRESRIYDPGYANDVFSGSGSAYLNLITCDGVWDGAMKSYSKRLVVFADIVR